MIAGDSLAIEQLLKNRDEPIGVRAEGLEEVRVRLFHDDDGSSRLLSTPPLVTTMAWARGSSG